MNLQSNHFSSLSHIPAAASSMAVRATPQSCAESDEEGQRIECTDCFDCWGKYFDCHGWRDNEEDG